jgi:hypothetical protein
MNFIIYLFVHIHKLMNYEQILTPEKDITNYKYLIIFLMNPHSLRYNVTLHSDSIPFNLYNEGFRGEFYGIFKTEFKLEPYLIRLHPSDRIYMCKLRCSNLKLPIETGRWANILMNPHSLRYNVTLHSDSIPFNLYNEGFLK